MNDQSGSRNLDESLIGQQLDDGEVTKSSLLALTVIRNPSDSSSRILPVRDVPIAGRSVRDTRVGAIPP